MLQAVILAAGKSTRTYPLTLTRPKPLLPVLNKPLLFYNLEQLVGLVDETIIVVGYMQEMVKEEIGDEFRGMPIRYVTQSEQVGTGSALQAAHDMLSDRFLVLNGDDLYERCDMEKLLGSRFAILAKRVENPSRYGILQTQGDKITGILEKPDDPPSDLGNTGLFMMDTRVFEYQLSESDRGEYEITDFIGMLAQEYDITYYVAEGYWLPLGYPWQLLSVNEHFMHRVSHSVEGQVEEGAVLKGPVQLAEGSLVKAGAYIEGPVVIGKDCELGPNCYIRAGTVLGDGCKVGNACEIKNSVLFEATKVNHLSYVGDSVLGAKVNLGAGTITANLRHDKEAISATIKDKQMNTGRKKFGAVLGDGAKTAIHTSIYPGRMMWPKTTTKPGKKIKYNIEE